MGHANLIRIWASTKAEEQLEGMVKATTCLDQPADFWRPPLQSTRFSCVKILCDNKITWTAIGIYTLLQLFIIGFGLYIIILQSDEDTKACSRTYDLTDILWANFWLHLFELFTFFFFRGGDESARGRALFLLIMLGACGVWSGLVLVDISATCESFFSEAYSELLFYCRFCCIANLTKSLLFFLHEAVPRRKFGCSAYMQETDLTLFINWDEEDEDEWEYEEQEVQQEEELMPPVLEKVTSDESSP